MNQVGVERDEMAPRMSEARTTFPNVIAITFVVFLGCEGNNEGDPSRVGTVLDAGVVDAGPVDGDKTWDPPIEIPACSYGIDAPLFDEAMAQMGLTSERFGFDATDLAQSDYETAGYLDDEARLSWFRDALENPGKLGCLEGEFAFPLGAFLDQAHPVSSAIRHAAVLLDAPPDTAPPSTMPPEENSFEDAIAAICAAASASGGGCQEPSGDLPLQLAKTVAPILWGIVEVIHAHALVHQNPWIPDEEWWRANGGNLLTIQPDAPAPDLHDAAERGFLLSGEHQALLYRAASQLAFAIEEVDFSAMVDLMGVSFVQDTPFGQIRFSGGENHIHADLGIKMMFFVDLGGDDTYLTPMGSNQGRQNPVSIAIDTGGKDVYAYTETGSSELGGLLPSDSDGRYPGDENYGEISLSSIGRQGSARDGVAMLFDYGGSDDIYRSLRGSQGYAQSGVGVLFDDGGDDAYISEATSQGAAQFGIGILMDAGEGDDTRYAFTQSQGFGYVKGAGFLVDGGGNDLYRCDHGSPELGGLPIYYSPQMPGSGNSSFCQGAGFGRRGSDIQSHLSGGLGILRDLGGDDKYEASVFGQGSGYWQGTGILSDQSGMDTYDAFYYVQGAAAHYAIGVLSDDGAESDHFNANLDVRHVHLGSGHDYSVGIMINEGGDDSYTFSSLAVGASNCNGVGIFIDNAGNDLYQTDSDYGSGMGNVSSECIETRPDAKSIGLMLDGAGNDVYEYPESNFPVPDEGSQWGHARNGLESEFGVGIDGVGNTGIHPGG
jgi:hypothetical protein